MKNKKSIEIKLTPTDIVELIEKKTGQKVSVDTHWFETSIENTREHPPYALVTFRAHSRK